MLMQEKSIIRPILPKKSMNSKNALRMVLFIFAWYVTDRYTNAHLKYFVKLIIREFRKNTSREF